MQMNNWQINQRVDLSQGLTGVSVWPKALMVVGDGAAHEWNVEVFDNGKPAALNGTVNGYFIRVDGVTIPIQGTLEGNVASVVLDSTCYAYEGDLKGILRVTDGKSTVTLSALLFRVTYGTTDQIVDPGTVIPSLDSLLAQIENMNETAKKADTAADRANTEADSANAAAKSANDAAESANAAISLANAATDAANAATSAANTATQEANDARDAANEAAGNTNAAIKKAEEATTNANAAADRVDASIESATNAAQRAEASADAADAAADKATNALVGMEEATTAANQAADAANTSASNADAATEKANTAASGADEAAKRANDGAERVENTVDAATKATEAANTAADAANTAAAGAETATSGANTAASAATSASESASEAASNATSAAKAANEAAERANQAAAGVGLQKKVVDVLPAPSEMADDTIYLVPAASPAESNIYEEYLKIDGAAELIGSTATDLTDYVKSDELTSTLESYAEKTELNNYIPTSERDSFAAKVDLDNYIPTSERDTFATNEDLETKADLTEGKVDPTQLPDHLIVGEEGELPPVELGLNADTLQGYNADHFASKTEMEAGLENKSDKVQIIEFSIPAIGWDSVGDELYSVVIDNESIRAKDAHIADLKQSGDEVEDKPAREAWAKVTRITASDGSITVYASEILESAIMIELATWADAVNKEGAVESEVFIVRRGIVGGGSSVTSIDNAFVTLDTDSWTFDGSEHCPRVTSVTLKGQPLTENKDFVCLYVPARDAGSYKVQVLGVLDYGGVVEAPWSITKAEGSVNISSNTITVKGIMGTADSTITVTKPEYCKVVAESQNPEFATAEIIDGSKVKITSVKAGIAYVIVKVSDDNFTEAETTLTVTVQKADGSISVAPSALTLKGEAGTSDTATLTVTGDGAISFSMQPDGIVIVERADKKLTVKSKAEGHTVITIKLAETKNYTGASCTLTVDTQFRLPVSDTLEENTWEAIADAAAAGEAAQHWNIGDTKSFTIGGETYHAQIIGFDHDDLDSSDAKYSDPSYNGGKKKAAITFHMKDCYDETFRMHTSDDNSCSWRDSEMRTVRMPDLLSKMEPEVVAQIRTVTKKTAHSQSDSTLYSTADKLFLLSAAEVFDNPSYVHPGEGTRYAYYAAENSRFKNRSGAAAWWWLRSPSAGSNSFRFVKTDGSNYYNYASNSGGSLAVGFCV